MTELSTLTIVELAGVIESAAEALTALIAILGIALVYVQIRAHRDIQREATAMNLFRQYLKEGIERPELVNPDHDQLKERGSLDQYQLFVANMLYSFDEVLQSTKTRDWREVVRGEVARHVTYLRSSDFQKQRGYYGDEILEVIDATCAGAGLETA